MNQSRKIIPMFLCLILLLTVLSAYADTFWIKYWKPGEYMVDFTSDEVLITKVMEESIRNSEGTPVRIDADLDSVEAQYERYISFRPDESPIVYEDTEYEDIGYFRWALGIPDDQSISRDEAWKMTLMFLIDQDLASPETLVHYYPQASFDIGFDPENPVWKITPVCYDYEETDLPITAWEVAVYAHDGSICGYCEVNGAG